MHSAAVKRYYIGSFSFTRPLFALIVSHQGLFMKFVRASDHYNKTLFVIYPQKKKERKKKKKGGSWTHGAKLLVNWKPQNMVPGVMMCSRKEMSFSSLALLWVHAHA